MVKKSSSKLAKAAKGQKPSTLKPSDPDKNVSSG